MHFVKIKQPAISIFTGVLGSLIATGITAFFQLLPLEIAVFMGLSGLCIYLAIMLFFSQKKAIALASLKQTNNNNNSEAAAATSAVYSPAGVMSVFVENKPQLSDFIDNCEDSFYFWGISAKRTASTPKLQTKLIQIGKRDGDIKFLLFNPCGRNLRRKAEDEGENWEAWKQDIYASIKRLKYFASKNCIKIDIRIYDIFPIWRLYIIDHKFIYVHYFISGQQGPQSPLLVLSENKGSLYWPFYTEFKLDFGHRA